MKLALSLATRGRPLQVCETITRSIANWRNQYAGTVLWVMADADDQPTVTAVGSSIGAKWDPDRIKMAIMPREDTIAQKWNRIVALEPDADVYMPVADDDPYITPDYDQKILDAAAVFPDGIGMVYGHMANASFTGVHAFTRKLVQLTGNKMYPEYFPYWFIDHWTDDVARLIGRISFADVRTDQTNVGKTQELREPAWWASFFDACYMMRREQAHSIINHPDFQSPPWVKDMMLRHHPLIEYRSRWINDNVRANARNLEQWSGLKLHDERYVRIKNSAAAMVAPMLRDPAMDPVVLAAVMPVLCPPVTVPSFKRAYG